MKRMKRMTSTEQQGQAMLEAIFIVLIFTLLLFAIQYSGHLRTRSLELLGESSYQTFLQSEHHAYHQSTHLANTSKREGLLQTFAEQLLKVNSQGIIDSRRLNNQASDRRVAFDRLFGATSLHRTSYLYVESGQGRSGRDVQSRIAQSKAAWRDVTGPTHVLLQPQIVPLSNIDSPWQRGLLQLDWLSRWSEQSPRKSSFIRGRE